MHDHHQGREGDRGLIVGALRLTGAMDHSGRILADMIDKKARRVQREVVDLRRLVARLRDTVAQDTPATEDTDVEEAHRAEA